LQRIDGGFQPVVDDAEQGSDAMGADGFTVRLLAK